MKTNLMVFLQPTILKDAAITAAHTGEKYNFIRAKQLKLREDGLRLADDEESPLLEEQKQFLTLPPPYQDMQQSGNQPGNATDLPPTLMETSADGVTTKPDDGGKQQ